MFFLEDYEAAVFRSEQSVRLLDIIAGHYVTVMQNFYWSLSMLSHYNQLSSSLTKEKYKSQVLKNQEAMRVCSENSPSNFKRKYVLVQAELARIEGDVWKAASLYDESIKLSLVESDQVDLAIAQDLAGKFWTAQDKEEFAEVYFKYTLTEISYSFYLGKLWRFILSGEQK